MYCSLLHNTFLINTFSRRLQENHHKMKRITIKNNEVNGGPTFKIPAHLSFGQYTIDNIKEHIENGATTALINGKTGHQITYQQLYQSIVDFASGLKRLGVKRGDVVALHSENRFEYLVSALGILCCGVTLTTINVEYTQDELTHILDIAKPNIIICSETSANKHLDLFKLKPYIKRIIQYDGQQQDALIMTYTSVLNNIDPQEYEVEYVDGASDIAVILYSSGTTGLPKGVMLTHVNIIYMVSSVNNYEQYDVEKNIRIQTIMPWYHAYGLMSTISNVICKKITIFFSEFHAETYLKAIQEYKANVLTTVPPLINFIAKSLIVEKYDLSSVRIVICGAAPLSSDTVKDAMKRLPSCMGIYQCYGMTETTLQATRDLQEEKGKPNSVGYPVRGVTIKVVDLETGQKLGPQRSGQICIKGPVVMAGYLGNEAATKDIIDKDGFLKTGDIGYYDEDGCFYLIDRIKELIKYNRHQVLPTEVERVLLQHPAVRECGVVGTPNIRMGELPTAFVVLQSGSKITEKELIDFAASKLPPAKRLHGGVRFLKDIPKNSTGKILRRQLKLLLLEGQSKL